MTESLDTGADEAVDVPMSDIKALIEPTQREGPDQFAGSSKMVAVAQAEAPSEPWKFSYSVRVGRDNADCIDLIFTKVAAKEFALYPNEAAYLRDLLNAADIPGFPATHPEQVAPIDMVLYCPKCGTQHIDRPDPDEGWDNPPHRSHKCHNPECGCIWRPADVETNGIASTNTKGRDDTWFGGWSGRAQPAAQAEAEQRPPYCGSGHCSCIECPFETNSTEKAKAPDDPVQAKFEAWAPRGLYLLPLHKTRDGKAYRSAEVNCAHAGYQAGFAEALAGRREAAA